MFVFTFEHLNRLIEILYCHINIFILYFFTRIVNFPVIVWMGYTKYDLPWLIVPSAVMLTLLNLYWFRLLVKKASTLRNIRRRKASDS